MDTEMKSEKDISVYSHETKVENRVFSWNLNTVKSKKWPSEKSF